ncbi:unknown [Ruminococcus sp. CAG:177]|nr:unknown [Ruminococcus sp. CAG:177]
MNLVYNIDSVLRFDRRKVCLVPKIADIVNAVV